MMMPMTAILRCSDFIPKIPIPMPAAPMIIPTMGINPAQKLNIPITTENIDKNLLVLSSGSMLV